MSEKLTGDFRKFMDKSFLGAWDLNDKDDTVLTIDHVERNEVKNDRGTEKKMTIHFVEQGYKPMICNTTNAKAISKAHGSTKVEDWEKKKIALYKATINAFGQTTECIRVREYAPKTDEIYCEVCGELITDVTVDGKTHKAKVIANRSLSKFGKYMCYDCASAAKAEQEAEA
jgi:uncharacterized protein YlaI